MAYNNENLSYYFHEFTSTSVLLGLCGLSLFQLVIAQMQNIIAFHYKSIISNHIRMLLYVYRKVSMHHSFISSFFVLGDTKCNNFAPTLKNIASVPHVTSLWQISNLSHSHSEHFCGYSDPFCTHSISESSLILPMSLKQCSYTCWKFEQKLWRMF